MKGNIKILFFLGLTYFLNTTAISRTLIVTDVAVFSITHALPDSSIIHFHKEDSQIAINSRLLLKLQLKTQENKRLTAFCLAVFLGHFGVHRLYLGTKPIVPISYVLTMGGGLGVLPAIDAIVILLSNDLDKLGNNSKFFMWTE